MESDHWQSHIHFEHLASYPFSLRPVRQEKDRQRGGIPLSAKGGRRDLVSSVHTISLKIALFSLSPGACLREAASA